MRTGLEMTEGRGSLGEGKHPVDGRLQPVAAHGAQQVTEHRARTDAHGVHCGQGAQERDGVDREGRAAEKADERDASAQADRAQRLGEGGRTADLQHEIHPGASRQLADAPGPLRGGAVVDGLRRTQGPGPGQLLVVAGGDDHADSRGAGQLQAEKGNAAGSLEEHG
jgi:hypothetical protein